MKALPYRALKTHTLPSFKVDRNQEIVKNDIFRESLYIQRGECESHIKAFKGPRGPSETFALEVRAHSKAFHSFWLF